LVEELEGKRPLGSDRRGILRWILIKWVVRMRRMWFRIWTRYGLL
jgi:hypothetical protein